ARSHHDAYRGIVRPFEIAVAGAAVDRRFHGFDQVAFEPHQNGLRLGIAEAAVEFKYHGAARGHHQAAIENAFVLGAFFLHAGYDGPHDVGEEPVAHLVIHDDRRRIGAHAASVRAGVAVADALVILGSGQ